MKLKKLPCFLVVNTKNREKDLRQTIIRSGYKGNYLVVEENSSYDLAVNYLAAAPLKEFLAAKKGLRKK